MLYLCISAIDVNNYKFQNPEEEITILGIQSSISFQNFLNPFLTLYYIDYNSFPGISSPHITQKMKSIYLLHLVK